MFKQKILNHSLFLVLIFITSPSVFADSVTSVSAATMVQNIANAVPLLLQMVTAIAFVLGMVLSVKGVTLFKHLGEGRGMYSRDHELKTPLIYLAVGAALLYLPTSIDVGLSTFWSSSCPYCYIQWQDQWNQFYNACFIIIQFIGVIAFIRGLLILTQSGEGHSQGAFKRALTHLIGGIFCINIVPFIQVILITLGITSS